ncbi:unnamed protein product [Lota lota]
MCDTLAFAFPTPPALAESASPASGAAAESCRLQSAEAGETSSGRPLGRQRHRAANTQKEISNKESCSGRSACIDGRGFLADMPNFLRLLRKYRRFGAAFYFLDQVFTTRGRQRAVS